MDNSEILRDIQTKVGEMHTTMFGAQGQGGIIRELKDIKQTQTEQSLMLADYPEVKKTVTDNNKIIIKAVAVLTVAGILIEIGIRVIK